MIDTHYSYESVNIFQQLNEQIMEGSPYTYTKEWLETFMEGNGGLTYSVLLAMILKLLVM